MTDRRDIPLDTAGEPGIRESEIRRLERRALIEQFSLTFLVVQRPEPAAHADKDGRAESVVLDDRHRYGFQSPFAPVVIAHPIRDDVGDAPIRHVLKDGVGDARARLGDDVLYRMYRSQLTARTE